MFFIASTHECLYWAFPFSLPCLHLRMKLHCQTINFITLIKEMTEHMQLIEIFALKSYWFVLFFLWVNKRKLYVWSGIYNKCTKHKSSISYVHTRKIPLSYTMQTSCYRTSLRYILKRLCKLRKDIFVYWLRCFLIYLNFDKRSRESGIDDKLIEWIQSDQKVYGFKVLLHTTFVNLIVIKSKVCPLLPCYNVLIFKTERRT